MLRLKQNVINFKKTKKIKKTLNKRILFLRIKLINISFILIKNFKNSRKINIFLQL